MLALFRGGSYDGQLFAVAEPLSYLYRVPVLNEPLVSPLDADYAAKELVDPLVVGCLEVYRLCFSVELGAPSSGVYYQFFELEPLR